MTTFDITTDETGHRRLLSDELLATVRERAAQHDRDNTFASEDIADLKAIGYHLALVPEEFGGAGLTLEEVCREQERLAGASPSTALAINMHQIWMGVARYVQAHGDDSADFIHEDAARGEIYAFGVSEPGNDLVLFGSLTEAEPQENGSYRLSGTKIFTTGGPSWTRLGTFGADRSDENDVRNVWTVLDRETEGLASVEDWDTLGMRASQSWTTKLEGAHAPAERIVRRLEPGPTQDPFVLGIFLNFEILLSAVYTGIARRALDITVEHVRTRRSVARDDVYATDPAIRWRLASCAIALDGIAPQITDLANAVDAGTPGAKRPLFMPQASALKSRATETALRVVEQCMRSYGGSGYRSKAELSRLYRDVLAGIFHPSDEESVHNAWANVLLGPIPSK